VPWLIFALLAFNFVAGLVVCYDMARREWHDRRLEKFRREVSKKGRRV